VERGTGVWWGEGEEEKGIGESWACLWGHKVMDFQFD